MEDSGILKSLLQTLLAGFVVHRFGRAALLTTTFADRRTCESIAVTADEMGRRQKATGDPDLGNRHCRLLEKRAGTI